ncbi:MAG: PEP-CTERM sorting domain-containing protein [Phycisphaeraceae bacterium]|nr:MAG: PEP-CTERM sorting domain-containing protein [Phycisphaeraceae bacterium]
MFNFKSAFIVASALSFAGAAHAGIVTAEFLGPRNGQFGAAGPNNQGGQTFTTLVGGELLTIDLFLRRNADQPVTMTLELWDLNASGLPTGTPLAEAVLETTLTEDWTWRTFDFSASGFVLDEQTSYAFTTRSESGDGGYLLGTATGNNYNGGRGIVKLGATASWGFMGNNFIFGERDVLFTANVIPAPGALALMGVAGVLGARRRRRCHA